MVVIIERKNNEILRVTSLQYNKGSNKEEEKQATLH
jgi:hypothetical protein